MITNFKLVNITKELIIAYNPTSSVCKGDSGQFDKFISLCKVYFKNIIFILILKCTIQVAL